MPVAARRFEPGDFHRDTCEGCHQLFPLAMLGRYRGCSTDPAAGDGELVKTLCLATCGPAAEKHEKIKAVRVDRRGRQ